MMEAVLVVQDSHCWAEDVSQGADQPLTIDNCVPVGRTGARVLFEIDGGREKADRTLRMIRTHPDTSEISINEPIEGVVTGSMVVKKGCMCRTVFSSDCFLETATTLGDGKVEWHIITGTEGALFKLIDGLREKGAKVEIQKIVRVENREGVTRRQQFLLSKALERGFFDYPRRTTIKRLSQELQVVPSTLREVLKRGEKNVIEEFFRGRV
jgi:predicted DNA binding protein